MTLAHTLGLTVTAEGVETAAQVATLRELGCDTAQGNYFASAALPEVTEKLLDQHLQIHQNAETNS